MGDGTIIYQSSAASPDHTIFWLYAIPTLIKKSSRSSPVRSPRHKIAVNMGSVAPNFKAETTKGPIDFHEFIGNNWVVLFSHPEDFTPVCTTELGAFAKLEPEFIKRGVKLIG